MLTLIMIGIALSMDTFSIALSLGTLGIKKSNQIFLITLVGFFHFFFPIIGMKLSSSIESLITINYNSLLGIIFLILFIKLIIDLNKNNDFSKSITKLAIIVLAISVSLDSLTTGLGIKAITNSFFISSLTFMTCSSIFTFLGLIIGTKANDTLGKTANYFGICLLLILAIIHLCK